MKKLLVIYAHPDDESFGPAGGTLAKYAAQGVQVHLVCATRGEAGVVDPAMLANGRSIAELRTQELSQAAATMGLSGVHYLDYRDSGMPGAPDNHHPGSLYSAPLGEIAERLASIITTLAPDVILTHDKFGWYGHPDHIKCYEAVIQAYQMLYGLVLCAGASGQPALLPGRLNVPALYVASFPKWPVKLAALALRLRGRNPRRCGQNQDVDLIQIAAWRVPVTTRINVSRYLAVKQSAIQCHASQRSLTQNANHWVQTLLNRIAAQESFYRLYPVCTKPERELLGLAAAPRLEKRSTGTLPAVAGV